VAKVAAFAGFGFGAEDGFTELVELGDLEG